MLTKGTLRHVDRVTMKLGCGFGACAERVTTSDGEHIVRYEPNILFGLVRWSHTHALREEGCPPRGAAA